MSVTRRILNDSYAILALRLALVMLLYTTCRVAFFIANHDLFSDMSSSELARAMEGGLLFDVSAVFYTNLLFIELSLLPLRSRTHPRYQHVSKWIYVVSNAVALAFDCSDIGYYRFTSRRTTSSFFVEFSHETNLGTIFRHLVVDYWPITLLWAVMVGVLWLSYDRLRPADSLAKLRPALYYPLASLLWLVATFWVSVGCRGGLYTRHHRPITNSNAGAFVDKPQHMSVVLNTPFSILRTLRQPPLERVHYFESAAELAKVFDPVHKAAPPRVHERFNVVLFILESFGAEHIGGLNRSLDGGTYQGFTPFLDSLMDKSLTFTNAFANGRKTIDAMPSVTASIPSLVEPFILSHYSANRVNSIASLLKARGYQTMFFHGAPNGSMGFQAFVKMAGYDRYFGMSEYGNDADYDGTWGIWDEEFFQFFARQLGEAHEPFFATLFSLSSHSPYKIPPRYAGKFRKGPMQVEKVINYSDYALRRFFETVEKQPWFDHTLFVLTADHGSALHRPQYRNLVGCFRIPLLFYTPRGELIGRDDHPAQQLDIMPTVLGYLGAGEDYVAFGHDLLSPTSPRFVVNYTDSTYQLIEDDYVLHWDGKRTVGLYRYRDDPLLKHDLTSAKPQVRARLERLLKAVVQQFNTRMLDDRLTTEPLASAMLH
jgi:arylsulfatase A-like enzyme